MYIEEACNYDPEATQNDGSCTFPETGYDCDGECLEDINENGSVTFRSVWMYGPHQPRLQSQCDVGGWKLFGRRVFDPKCMQLHA